MTSFGHVFTSFLEDVRWHSRNGLEIISKRYRRKYHGISKKLVDIADGVEKRFEELKKFDAELNGCWERLRIH